MRKILQTSLAMLLVTAFLFGCGGGTTAGGGDDASGDDASGDDASGDGSDSGSTITDQNALAVAYPSDLALTSITASSSSTSALSAVKIKGQEAEGDAEAGSEDVIQPQTFEEKKEEMQGILTAQNPEDVQMTVNFTKEARETTCYGPILFLNQSGGTGHPDGQIQGQGANGSQSLPPGDTGIQTASDENTGEACIAAQMNYLQATIQNYTDIAQQGTAAMLALLNTSTETPEELLPASGVTEDYTEEVVAAIEEANASETNIPLTPTLVEMSRSAEDTAEGDPIYTTEMVATIDAEAATPPALKSQQQQGGDQQQQEGGSFEPPSEMEVSLTHAPANEENTEYSGVMSHKVSFDSATQFGGNAGGCTGATECISVRYTVVGTEANYLMKRAQFCGTDADCFDANGEVDLTNTYSSQQGGQQPPPTLKAQATDTSGWFGNAYHSTCNINKDTGNGRCCQAWQAGAGDRATRVFCVEVSGDSGTGYFGYGDQIQSIEGAATIEKMICNWVGPGGSINSNNYDGLPLTQRQTFTRNADGIFVVDTSNISFAPTTTCDKAAGSFAFGMQDLPTDHPTSEAIENDLISIEEIDLDPITVPELVTAVTE